MDRVVFKDRQGVRIGKAVFAALVAGSTAGMLAFGAQAQEYKWRGGTGVPPTDIIAQSLDFFAQRVTQLSNGRISISTHHGGSIGGDRDLIEGLLLGSVQLAVPGQALLAGWYKPAEIWTFPYLFKDVAHKDRVWDTIKMEYAEDIAKEAKLRTLASVPRAPRMLSANKVVATPADMKGLKIRVPETPMWRKTFERFGAAPTPMPFPEVYQALKARIIDGQDNPIALSWNTGFFEVNTHLNLTEHMMQDNVIVVGDALFQKLPQDLRQAVLRAATETEQRFRPMVAAEDAELLNKVKAKGVTITAVDKSAFKASVAGLENEFPHVKKWYDRFAQIQ